MSGNPEAVGSEPGAGGDLVRGGNALVGRDEELRVLLAGLDEAFAGHGRLFSVYGEPGIGKTRLAHELADLATSRGARVLWGRCWEGGGAPPYWPWVQVLRAYVREESGESLRSVLGTAAAEIVQIVPELREHLAGPDAAVPADPEQARFRLFDAVSRLLDEASRVQPLVVILDDLHDADLPSLRLLQFVARQLARRRTLLLATYRDLEVRRNPAVAELLGEVTRESPSMLLRGLTERDVARVIELSSFLLPNPRLVAAIHRTSDGNPFFLREIIQLVTASRGARPEGGFACLKVPDGVREIIRRRLEPLSENTRRILATAAVLGRDFALEPLQRVAQLAPAEIAEALEEAVAARVLVEIGAAPHRYSFAHALVRETLYDGLDAGARIRLHRAVGEALEEIHGADSEAHLDEIAHHYYEAAAVGSGEKAVEYATRAARRCVERLAYEDAVDHYTQALAVLDLSLAVDTRRCGLLLALGETQWKAGARELARQTFQQAAELARRLGTPEQLATAAMGFARMLRTNGMPNELAASRLEESLQALGEQDSALRMRLLSRLAWALYATPGTRARRAALIGHASALADRLGDPDCRTWLLHDRHWALWEPQTLAARRADAQELVQLATECGDRESALKGRYCLIVDLMESGDAAAADAEIGRYARLAEEARQPWFLWFVPWFRAMRALMQGRFAESERLIAETRSRGRLLDESTSTFVCSVQTMALHYARARFAEMEATARRLAESYPMTPAWRAAGAMAHGRLGRLAEARQELDALATGAFSGIPRDYLWLCAMCFLAETCAAVHDTVAAATLYDLLRPYAGRCVVVSYGIAALGSVSRPLALLAATLGRWEDAQEHFEAAIAADTGTGGRVWVHAVQRDFAAMLLRRGRAADRKQAKGLLAEARRSAEELGITIVEQSGAEQAAAAPRAPGSTQRAATLRREGECWTISFQGELFRVADSKGLHYIAHLVRNPDKELRATDLVALCGGNQPLTPDPQLSREQLDALGGHAGDLGDAGSVLDPQAKAAYRKRLADLRAELAGSEDADSEEARALQAEIDFLQRQLASATGLGGRDRRAASVAERARVSVTKAIGVAIKRISRNSAALSSHLAGTIKTGTFCSYVPDPRQPVQWRG